MSCAICGAAQKEILVTILRPDRFESHLGIPSEGYERAWIACELCGTAHNIFLSGRACNLDQLEKAYYEVDYLTKTISERYCTLMALPPGKSDNIDRVDRISEWLNNWIFDDFRVLDIGAGTGVFLTRFLEKYGNKISNAVGIEPDPLAASHLRALNKFTVVEDSFPTSRNIGSFELVTLNKVLEHIGDPVAFLKKVEHHLSGTKGICYVEVPDALTASHKPSADNILGSLHCHLYTPSGLGIALQSAGLLPLRIERIAEASGKLSIYAFAIPQSVSLEWMTTK